MSARWGIVGLVVCLAGCPHQPASDAGVHDAPAPVDAGPPQPETVSIAVVDQFGPVAGAMLFVDDADGMRHTATADSGGLATFSNVPWTPGAISITSVAPNHPIQTLAGFRRSDLGDRADGAGMITVLMSRSYDPSRVSGSLLNINAADTVTLSASVPGSITSSGTTFSGFLMPGVPLHVFALEGGFTMQGPQTETFELRALVDVPHDALTGDAMFDIDMESSVAFDTASGFIVPPMDGTPLAHIYPRLTVSTDESELQAVLGRATTLQVTDTTITYNAQFAQDIEGTPVTVLYISSTTAYTQLAIDGLPTQMLVTSSAAWAAPPVLATPANESTAGLNDPITFRSVDPTAPVVATVLAGVAAVWTIELPAAATSFTIPVVPEGTDTTSWGAMLVLLDACQRWPGHHTHCSRTAGGQFFSATLP